MLIGQNEICQKSWSHIMTWFFSWWMSLCGFSFHLYRLIGGWLSMITHNSERLMDAFPWRPQKYSESNHNALFQSSLSLVKSLFQKLKPCPLFWKDYLISLHLSLCWDLGAFLTFIFVVRWSGGNALWSENVMNAIDQCQWQSRLSRERMSWMSTMIPCRRQATMGLLR